MHFLFRWKEGSGRAHFESQTLRCRDHPGFPIPQLVDRSRIGSKLCVLKIWNPTAAEAASESRLLGDRIKQLARYQLMMAQLSQNISRERWLTAKATGGACSETSTSEELKEPIKTSLYTKSYRIIYSSLENQYSTRFNTIPPFHLKTTQYTQSRISNFTG